VARRAWPSRAACDAADRTTIRDPVAGAALAMSSRQPPQGEDDMSTFSIKAGCPKALFPLALALACAFGSGCGAADDDVDFDMEVADREAPETLVFCPWYDPNEVSCDQWGGSLNACITDCRQWFPKCQADCATECNRICPDF
jgi:hypothetical protein